MLWVMGILLAFLGSMVHSLAVWNNMHGGDKKERGRMLVFLEISFSSSIYVLLIFMILSMYLPKYTDNLVLLFGLGVSVMNLGRAYFLPEIAEAMKEEKICFGRSMVIEVQPETFAIYMLLIAVLIYAPATSGGVVPPLGYATTAMAFASLGAIAGSLLMAFLLKRELSDNPAGKCRDGFVSILIKTIPGHAIGIMGVLGAVMILLPYL